jgi:hypothetical protein
MEVERKTLGPGRLQEISVIFNSYPACIEPIISDSTAYARLQAAKRLRAIYACILILSAGFEATSSPWV